MNQKEKLASLSDREIQERILVNLEKISQKTGTISTIVTIYFVVSLLGVILYLVAVMPRV
ncbi:hypothetical protein C943_03311 [Mariniradius saccharolyticus AK6]|uniref:Uncharacterized protein n=1 Tax=Mariniradius saccharolyticus AK6 TaxID=1239962 RepID=M7XIG1_9BACT|nr:hypothetical protein [Mariniradius saccharolyticus]EMS34624.1 hypothetical protein C943_03311 [Mariniradius saccharolyticus AK6]